MTGRVAATREVFSKVEVLWDLVSDIRNEGAYWSCYRDVRVVSASGGLVEVETSAPWTAEVHLLLPRKRVAARLMGGLLEGERVLTLVPMGRNSTRVDVEWTVDEGRGSRAAFGLVCEEMARLSQDALNRFAESAERSGCYSGSNITDISSRAPQEEQRRWSRRWSP